MDIREAGYTICPAVMCRIETKVIQGEQGEQHHLYGYDKQMCIPSMNQRSKWVSWANPMLLQLEKAYDRSHTPGYSKSTVAAPNAIGSTVVIGPTLSYFSSTLKRSLVLEQKRKEDAVQQNRISPARLTEFARSMDQPGAKGYSRIELDVDHRDSFGPETVTFTNVPPGLYKIAVHAFSTERRLRDASPTVKFWLGDSVLVHCTLDRDSCADPEYSDIRWWNVATLRVEKLDYAVNAETTLQGSRSKQQTYRVRLFGDERKGVKRLQYRDLPTREDVALDYSRSSRRRYYSRTQLLNTDSKSGSKEENNWTLLSKTCVSRCRIEKGDRDSCIGSGAV